MAVILDWLFPKKTEEFVEKIFGPREGFTFIADIKKIIHASKKVFLIDNYLTVEFLESILGQSAPAYLRLLVGPNTDLTPLIKNRIIEQFQDSHIEVKQTADVHDRVIFADRSCWVCGISFQHAASKKPTYIRKLLDVNNKMRHLYEGVWRSAHELGSIPKYQQNSTVNAKNIVFKTTE